MALNLLELWNHRDTSGTESRLRQSLPTADFNEAVILETQIARTYGLRQRFAEARDTLAALKSRLPLASAEANARYWLEWGRTWSSATHQPETQTVDAQVQAKDAFMSASKLALNAGLNGLAVDALHMMAFAEPNAALEWNLKTLAIIESTDDPEAQRWEASIRNNIGCDWHAQGDFEAALEQFRLFLAAREREGDTATIQIARWMIAWAYRSLERYAEALDIQLKLQREFEADGETDPYVLEELIALYKVLTDDTQAARFETKLNAFRTITPTQ